jgi:Sulfotransferase domain
MRLARRPTGGFAVEHEEDRTTRQSQSRRDLAGRLFRPNWPLFRAPKSSVTTLEPRTGGGTTSQGGQLDSARQPKDVICGGMYRACSTWQYEVIAHLIEQHHGGQCLGYLTGGQYAELTQSTARAERNPNVAAQGWRVVKSHEGHRSFACAIEEGRAVAVYAYRDVRDVVFSLMHKRGMAFEPLLRQGMIHQILANDRFWMAQPGLLVQRYEELLLDPARGVMDLAAQLGISLEESEVGRIADLYSQESNKARAEALKWRLEKAGVDLENAANAQICDPTTLLHWNHIRQGTSRPWRSLATPQQKKVLHGLCGRWLLARGYSLADNEPGEVKVTLPERVRGEIDLKVARATYLARSTSQRFPRAARVVKRMLGMPVEAQVGAKAWADGAAAGAPGDRRGAAIIKAGRNEREHAASESRIT